MKKFIFILAILAIVAQVSVAQKKYATGYRTTIALSSATTISLTPQVTQTTYTLAADTNVTFSATTTKSVPGDILYFKVKANTRARVMVWGSNIDSPNDTVASGKTVTFGFLYVGSSYLKLSRGSTD